MASKRRSFLYLLGGAVVVAAKGADEAATLLAKGTDEAIEAVGKSGDDAAKSGDEGGSVGDDVAESSIRAIRRDSLESLYEDETASHTFTLQSDYYGGYEINPTHRTQLTFEYNVLFDDVIDVFILDEQSFSEYESTGEIHTGDQPYIVHSSSGTRTTTLSPTSTYYLIFDNTDASLTAAQDEIRVDTDASLAVIN